MNVLSQDKQAQWVPRFRCVNRKRRVEFLWGRDESSEATSEALRCWSNVHRRCASFFGVELRVLKQLLKPSDAGAMSIAAAALLHG